MSNQFYSNGKLLITGEYFVLNGATAFAIPLKVGQGMDAELVDDGKDLIYWSTSVKNQPWFTAIFSKADLSIVDTNNRKSSEFIQKLLRFVKDKSAALNASQSVRISANVEFAMEWGFGSSATLIANLAQWAKINPYELLFATTNGSGYDVACAMVGSPILYKNHPKPEVVKVDFSPSFLNKIYFIYLGQKQNSAASVEKLGQKVKGRNVEADRISAISKGIVKSTSLREFGALVDEHERIVATTLDLELVKQKLFPDFDGSLKSLGAWGGDFIMATHSGEASYVYSYFNSKGLDVIFPYNHIVL
ncbi:MAG: GYDIA family GHMP kinase [Bacteroidales bacterium]|nr:GYDIA family GHMP kinase [Bacteroidales bacterium]